MNLRGFGQTTQAVSIFIISFLFFLRLARPFDFGFMRSGLDPSWVAVSTWARESGLAFGSDFVFTAGPLSNFYTRYFSSALSIPFVLLWLLFVSIAALVLARLLLIGKAGWGHWALALASILLLSTVAFLDFNSLMFFVCLLLAVSTFQAPRSRSIEILLPFVMAALSLAKFSVFPLAVVSVVLSDLMRVSSRQAPCSTIVFGLSIVGLFLSTGGTLTGLVAFLISYTEVAAGYTVAMALNGRFAEVAVWATIALLFVGGAAVEGKRTWSAPFALLLAVLGFYLFICMKAGFVRHDGHGQIAWSGLSLAAMIWAVRSAGYGHALWALLNVAFAIGSADLGHRYYVDQNRSYVAPPAAVLAQVLTQANAGLELIRSPAAWLSARQARQASAVEAVKAAKPLPALAGTVDILPSAQAEVIANGLNYRPRPTVQEYNTYSQPLIARNRAFFSGDRAPDYFLFQPGSIDGRHPASAEGPLWPLFLTRYETSDWTQDYLLLKRRDVALQSILNDSVDIQGSFEEAVAFPRRGQPEFVSIDVRPNLIGRLAAILLKLPELNLELTFSDGAQSRYRLIPDIHREGVLLSPTVNSVADYANLANGILADFPPSSWPVAIRVTGSAGYSYFYDRSIRFRFASLDLEPLRRAATGTRFLDSLNDRMEDLRAAKSRLKPNPPYLVDSPEGIFAHAPSEIAVATEGATRVRLGFGIRAGAYDSGDTDGVCFSVRLPGAGGVLFERCLDPKTTAKDRGIVEATVDLPAGTNEVIAATSCRSNCNWDWSFWTRIRPEPSTTP
ncbi:transmembrane protein [Rhodoplanes sp. Z2-YC6860]|nr:transmembrane protein [Rhodoplanes sp. Z2-YC6860]